MFKELFPLAAQGAFSLLLSADEASGLMTVVVVPKHSEGGKDVPALAMPLKLTAVPDELGLPRLEGGADDRRADPRG